MEFRAESTARLRNIGGIIGVALFSAIGVITTLLSTTAARLSVRNSPIIMIRSDPNEHQD